MRGYGGYCGIWGNMGGYGTNGARGPKGPIWARGSQRAPLAPYPPISPHIPPYPTLSAISPHIVFRSYICIYIYIYNIQGTLDILHFPDTISFLLFKKNSRVWISCGHILW